ncbi:MAG: AgmX/PglI C-terminal domain-containing protein [Candidatus Riflebacteria bacterium]|nr:AgmX/PglI C-terminal domain-containing protein [Candidatus Riflebacteria bacterium]
MKHKLITFLSIFFLFISAMSAICQPETNDDKTLAPYFKVMSDDPSVEQLPLKSTSADVKIAGVIADITVSQVYKNEGKKPIEAIYVFPGSTRAAVYGLKMTIGTRTIVAQIKKKEEARQEYETAKKAGKSASLLEQERPNVFTMNVANILPGDEIKVDMNYTELLVPTEGVYDFVYPTVVGPRYSNQKASEAPQSEKWIANPYLKEGEASKTTFDIKIALSTGLPLQEAVCSSHKVNIAYEKENLAKITLDESEKYGGNRDFILKYRLAGGKIESGLLLSQGDKENFFLLMVQPPKRVEAKNIPAREYIFIVDISGSMNGFPLEISKELLKTLIGNLRPTDVFNVLLFAGSAKVFSESGSVPANSENIEKAMELIRNQYGGGSTELIPALKTALALPHTPNTSRSIIIATDGYVAVENEAFDLIRKNLGNANVFSFGIGTAVNRFLMEGIARAGMGESFIITKKSEAPAQAEKFRKYVESPVLTQIKADFGNFDVHAVEPPSIPDVLAERPVIVFGKWKGKNEGTIKLTGTSGEGAYEEKFDVSAVKPLPENSGLRYLWARHQISVLSDHNSLRNDPEIVAEVTKLGLDYNLLTAYTSFIAVDSEARVKNGEESTTVKQPLPLPEGVSNLAVSRMAPGAPMMARSKGLSLSSPPPSPSSSNSLKEDGEACDSFANKLQISDSTESKKKIKSPAPEVCPEPAPSPQKNEKHQSNINIGGIVTGKGISSDSIKQSFEEKINLFEALFEKAKKSSPSLSGKVTLEIKVASNGKPTEVKIASSELNNEEFEKKITELIKRLIFKTLKNSSEVEFTVVLTFQS